MSLATTTAHWHDASGGGVQWPSARQGQIAVAVYQDDFGTELVIFHGGVSPNKTALSDLSVLSVEQQEFLQLEPSPSAVGPAARAFHAAAVTGRRVWVFGGNVFLPDQKRLHQFNDLWALDTDTWQWHRQEAAPDLPQPVPRDRAAMVALAENKLLIYGGADALNRRLDDAWVYCASSGSWSEVKAPGARPKPRCCTSLFTLGNRVLLFGGDCGSAGASNELWSLRGVLGGPAAGGPQWTQLQLDGPVPAPRRGHAAACIGASTVFVGGYSEQISLLGMKKQSEHLADVVMLDRQADRMVWKAVDVVTEGPAPREKHTLVALSGGRALLFGGTDGVKTLGDAWWLDLEEISGPPQLMSVSDLEKQMAAQKVQQRQSPVAAAGVAPTATTASFAAPPTPDGNYSYWPSLPASLQPVAGLTSALTSLRDRLGLPGTLPQPQPPHPGMGPGSAAPHVPAPASALRDEGLLRLGRQALAAASSGSDQREQLERDAERLVHAARSYLAACSAEELKLGDVPTLLADYRRLARVGWAAALAAGGAEALADIDTALPGRFYHFTAEEVRLREVAAVLREYRELLAAAAAVQKATPAQREAGDLPGSAAAAAAAEARGPQPTVPPPLTVPSPDQPSKSSLMDA